MLTLAQLHQLGARCLELHADFLDGPRGAVELALMVLLKEAVHVLQAYRLIVDEIAARAVAEDAARQAETVAGQQLTELLHHSGRGIVDALRSRVVPRESAAAIAPLDLVGALHDR